jgi:hypothetical protein
VASLYDGTIIGNNYLILKGHAGIQGEYPAQGRKPQASLCDSFPSIQGYITGRVDRIVSLRNEGAD